MNEKIKKWIIKAIEDYRTVENEIAKKVEELIFRKMEIREGCVSKMERSLIRLVVVMLIDINEEWLTGRRYLDMEENSL